MTWGSQKASISSSGGRKSLVLPWLSRINGRWGNAWIFLDRWRPGKGPCTSTPNGDTLAEDERRGPLDKVSVWYSYLGTSCRSNLCWQLEQWFVSSWRLASDPCGWLWWFYRSFEVPTVGCDRVNCHRRRPLRTESRWWGWKCPQSEDSYNPRSLAGSILDKSSH